MKYLNKI